MKVKNNKLGFKFFWVYLMLGGFSAFGNFISYLEVTLENNDPVQVIYNAYATLMCFSFMAAAILFILSILFLWKKVYRIAYYIHTFFIGLCLIERTMHMIASCYYGEFFVVPICLGYIGLIILDFLYFRKRNHLKIPQIQTYNESEVTQ